MTRNGTVGLALAVAILAGCGNSMALSAEAADGPSGGGRSMAEGASGAADRGGEPEPGEGVGGQQQAGVLTAGVWDDNLNFDFFEKYVSLSGTLQGVPSFSPAERAAARDRWSQRTGASELDVAFVIDTTGSMGDELKYLQTEIDDIAASIQAKHPQMIARYGLVLYRDRHDDYLTRAFDFDGLDGFRAKLAAANVAGGGDYPEAVPDALHEMNALTWREGAVARVAFWVADAPHHVGREDLVKVEIEAAAAKGVHVYPVAASGTDARAEFTMRAAAQITGGRFVFLTDDSGVGNAHAEPSIPCYHVTKFNGALVRMIESELSGARVEAAPEEIIRTVGNPTNGQCVTATHGSVSIY